MGAVTFGILQYITSDHSDVYTCFLAICLQWSSETCEHKNALRTRSARTGEQVSLHVHVQVYALTVQYVANILAAFFPFK